MSGAPPPAAAAGTVALEVALNGPWGPRQPGAPLSVAAITADGLACAAEGAAILHVHAWDPDAPRQTDAWETYARIIEGVRARSDALVYPTIPLSGADPAAPPLTPAERFAHVEALAARGLIEWTVVDPGTVNFVEPDRPGFVYRNAPEEIRHGLALCAERGLRPSYALYEPGFARAGALLAAEADPAPKTPVYRAMFSEGFAWGFPPEARFLEAWLDLLDRVAPGAPWMAAGLAVDVLPLAPLVVARGGMLRVGLEDAPFGDTRSNLDWTRAARAAVEAAGGRLESAAEARARLG